MNRLLNILNGNLCFVMLLLLTSSVAMSTSLQSLDIRNQNGKTSIFGVFSGPVIHNAFVLKTPNRVVVDLKNTTTTVQLNQIHWGNTIVQRVRIGYPNKNTLRLVFEVTKPVALQTLVWQPRDAHSRGLRLDLAPVGGKSSPSTVNVAKIQPESRTYSQQRAAVIVSRPPSKGLRDVVVVLDPGHGGKDPGAMGTHHTMEKHIVLAIAYKLKKLIDSQPGMRAVLTRDGDYYVGLRERMKIARKHNADLFVAIHADAYANHNSNGASVFALSQRGATSEAARWLAEKENYSELGGVNLSGLDDKNGVIRTVLIDLSQTATIGASLQMGNRVLQGLDKMTRLHSHKVEQARFMVLKSPDIPSVLIETGFISNPREEMNLTNPAYQNKLTSAIFAGVKDYFWDYPPHNSRIEAMSQANRATINTAERSQKSRFGRFRRSA